MRRQTSGSFAPACTAGVALLTILMAGYAAPTGAAAVIYVKSGATGAGNGTSWADAFLHLQDGLAAALAGDEIWVAAGTYRPTLLVDPGDSRSATFRLQNGLAIIGGFSGTETDISQRGLSDPATPWSFVHETILSGDLDQNDDPGNPFANLTNNAYHVLMAESGLDRSAILDGVVVAGGAANGTYLLERNHGGGLWIGDASPTVRNCVFKLNYVLDDNLNDPSGGGGGAIYDRGEQTLIAGCLFERNAADQFASGAGILCDETSTTVVGCEFRGNGAQAISCRGLVQSNAVAFPHAINCRFIGNSATAGGALSAAYGGIHLRLTNCLFVANQASWGGAVAACGAGARMTFVNCTMTANDAPLGAGPAIYTTDDPSMNYNVQNCIFWDNKPTQVREDAGTFAFSCIQNQPNVALITADPLFERPPSRGPDGTWDGNQDDYGDVHLQAGSPCLDAGINTPNGEILIGVDLDGNIRRVDDPAAPNCPYVPPPQNCGALPIVDMGAYERGATAVPARLYVNDDSNGVNTGLSWTDGFTNLKTSLTTALASAGRVQELWVAGGTYKPAAPGGVRSKSFQMLPGVTLLGGFVGIESNLAERDLADPAGLTILSGDLNGGDASLTPGQPLSPSWSDNSYHVVDTRGADATAILDGFTIAFGNASAATPPIGSIPDDDGGGVYSSGGGATLRNCLLRDNAALQQGGGFFARTGRPVIDGLAVGWGTSAAGGAGLLERSRPILAGPLTLLSGTPSFPVEVQARSCLLAGPGGIVLSRDSVLRITESPSYAPVVIHTPVAGTGTIAIGLGQYLIADGGAIIDLSGAAIGGCADPNQSANWGLIDILGTFEVRAATIQNANVEVRLATIGSGASILNNDIRLSEANSFGGQFVVENGALIQCNVIRADGDRFLDFDPDPSDGELPVFGSGANSNRIFVTMLQGTSGEQGELLELRSEDFDHGVNSGRSGAYELASSAGDGQSLGGGYNDTWAFQQLQILADAKVNLTNRPGFDFQPGSVLPEVLYVKDIVLHEGAVLNCGLQRVYYQRLLDAPPNEGGSLLTRDAQDPTIVLRGGVPHARILDVPLLGFSLKVVNFDDPTAPPANEFDVRIRPRLRDPGDVPPPAAPFREGSCQRLDGLGVPNTPGGPASGAMRICTRNADSDPPSLSASSVAAHGAFARAGEDHILIEFDYLFENDPNAELLVYLSDSPEPRDPTIPIASDPNFLFCATIRPPQAGLPGSIGSGAFAVFSGEFRRDNSNAPGGALNFTRGTYVELELRSSDPAGACVRIDRFDPQIRCTGNQCGDVTGENAVTASDYLGYVAWYGRAVGGTPGTPDYSGCLDPQPTSDKYIDINDLLAADGRLVQPPPGNLCSGYAGDSPQNGTAVCLPTTPGFLMLGKAGLTPGEQPDLFYALDAAGGPGSFPGGSPNAPVTPTSLPRLAGQHRADIRLIQDSSGPGGGNPTGGNVYLLHLTQGLYRVDTGALLLIPSTQTFGADTIHVGVRPYYNANDDLVASPPLLDAAFDPNDANIVYVAPVLVQPGGLGNGYRAAARLLLNGDGTFVVQQVYGSSPASDPCVNSSSPESSVYDIWNPRELELDADGNLFVLSAKDANANDWLLMYEAGSGAQRRFCFTDTPSQACFTAVNPPLRAPTAMKLTADGTELYLTAAMNDPAATAVSVSRFTVQHSGGIATGLTPAGSTQLTGMRHVLSLVEVPGQTPAQRRWWAFGFTGPTFTQLPYLPDVTPPLSDYATALRADFAPGDASATAVAITAHASNAVALPLSVIYRPSAGRTILPGDTNCSGSVDFFDIDPFLLALFNPAGYPAAYPNCDLSSADCNGDTNVDFFDIDPFLDILFGP